jgi:hypothetical protein
MKIEKLGVSGSFLICSLGENYPSLFMGNNLFKSRFPAALVGREPAQFNFRMIGPDFSFGEMTLYALRFRFATCKNIWPLVQMWAPLVPYRD